MEKIHLGILGAGLISQEFLSIAHELPEYQVEMICATKRSIEKLEKLTSLYGIPSWTTDEDELITNEKIDTVYIALPNHMHYETMKKCLAAGKNIICEKPFTSTIEETKEILELAKEKGIFIFEAVTNRCLPNVLEIQNRLESIGRVRIVSFNYSQYSSRYDDFLAGKTQPVFDPAKSGGALMDLNIYNINLAVTLFGAPDECRYYANVERGIDTSGTLILSYPDFTCVCIGAKDCKAPLLSTIQGNKGSVLIPDATNEVNGFIFTYNEKSSSKTGAIDLSAVENLNEGRHRMIPEFHAFAKIMEENDRKAMDMYLKMTEICMDIQTQARREAGVLFPVDEKYIKD